jgi:DNA modification methylase
VKVGDLKPNPKNPRTITDEKATMLRHALAEFGDLSGIVYNRKTERLVGGHQRTKVFPKDAKVEIQTRFKKPTKTGTVAEGFVLVAGERFAYREVAWSSNREKAANIAANKGAGEWDSEQLSKWVRELHEADFDLGLTMYDESEIEAILNAAGASGAVEGEDDVPALPKKPKSKLGDVYQLGKHRLLCGDSTNLKTVEKLMGGAKADMCFTSPPYNGNTELNSHKMVNGKRVYSRNTLYQDNESDNKSSEEYLQFNRMIFSCLGKVLKPNGNVFYNIGYNAKSRAEWLLVIQSAIVDGFFLFETIVWKKKGMPNPAPNVMTRDWEFIFLLNRSETYQTNKKYAGYSTNFWEISNQNAQSENHKACFPIALPEKAILETTNKGDLLFEPFGGSGTTMIACEKTNRQCYMMELDPGYCDVIVERWETFTGKKAKKL